METVLIALSTSLATALVTVFLAFWRFQTERWWDLKVEAYLKIFESLYHLKNLNEHRYMCAIDDAVEASNCDPRDPNSQPPTNNAGMESEIKMNWDAMREIDKLINISINIGSFIIDKRALNELIEFKKHYIREAEIGQDIEEDFELTYKIDSVLPASVRDLVL